MHNLAPPVGQCLRASKLWEGRKPPKNMGVLAGKPLPSGSVYAIGGQCLATSFYRLDSPPRSFGEGPGVGLKQMQKLAQFNLSYFCGNFLFL